jgi:integrase
VVNEALQIARPDERRKPRRVNFTKRLLEDLTPPERGQRAVYDTHARGLCLLITPTGSKTFYRYGRIDGRPQRVRVGTFPDVSIENARRVVAKLSGEIADGKDPAAERRARRETPTLGEIFDRFLSEYAKIVKRSWREDKRQFDTHLAGWRSRRLRDIRKSDVRTLHAKLGGEHPTAANRLLALLSRLFTYAAELDLYGGENPAARIKKFAEHSRSRFLNADEVARFWAAVEAEPNPVLRDFFKVALLTGGRRSAVLAMKWVDLNLDAARWTITAADSKSGREIALPLPPAVVAILRNRRTATAGPWVFPSAVRKGRHVVEPRSAWTKIRTAAGLTGVVLHDLRRTRASWQATQGSSTILIGASLGHAPGSAATAVYARLADEAVRTSIDSAASAMLAAVEAGRPDATTGSPRDAAGPSGTSGRGKSRKAKGGQRAKA